MSIQTKAEEIVEEFSMFTDRNEKYEHLIALGKELPLIDEKYKTDDFLIKGCQSLVWLRTDTEGDKVVFTADSNAFITKGMISLLVKVFSHEKPGNIVNADLSFIDRIGLNELLGMNRSNGLSMMVKQMKLDALALQSKLN